MNLWAKSVGQLLMLAVALFFFSCEDETSILGFKNPNKQFNVRYIEIPLNSSVVLLDSLITDNASNDGNVPVLAGRYPDPVMGQVYAQPFFQLYPTSSTTIDQSAVYDSVTLDLRLNFYSFGLVGKQEMAFSVHQLLDTITYYKTNKPTSFGYPTTFTYYEGNNPFAKRYYSESTIPYSPFPLGEVAANVIYDTLQANLARTNRDTLLLSGRIDDDYGYQLFSIAKFNPNNALTNFKTFRSLVRGLTLVPKTENGVLGLNIGNGFSRAIVHYHTVEASGAVKDTLTRSFPLNFAAGVANLSFSQINIDRSGSELAGAQSYQAIDPNLRYVQSGAPVITQVDLSNFYQFADTVDNILINSAEFVIEQVQAQPGFKPHDQLMFRIMNPVNRFLRRDEALAAPLMEADPRTRYYVYPDGFYFTAVADAAESSTDPARIGYSNGTYSGFITRFAQKLYFNKDDDGAPNPSRFQVLGLFPYTPPMSKSVTRTIFDKSQIKLRIHYTKPTEQNP